MHLFWHELRRLARRGRPALGRIAFGLLLLIALAASFARAFPTVPMDQLATTYFPNRRGISEFGVRFALVIAYSQLFAIVALTPLVCGGALAIERVRGTLDLLRLSHSKPGAIIGGKFAAHFLFLGSFLVIGLPISFFAQLWGDVDLAMIAGCYVINVYVLAAAIGICLWCSAEVKNVPAGIAISYVVLGIFAIILQFLPWFNPAKMFGEWQSGRVVSLKAIVLGSAWFYIPIAAAGLIAAVRRLARDGAEREPGLVPMSGSHAAPPAEIDARLLAPIDVRRFRFLYQPIGKLLPRAAALRVLPTPRVREHPMLWKELYFGGNALTAELLRTAALAVILIEVLVGAVLLVQLMDNPLASIAMSRQWHATFESLSVNSLAVAMLSVTAFAAGSITLEREHKTLDGLLALPEGRPAVLLTKWLGSMLRVRWVLVVALLPLIAGLSIGSFHGLPVAVLSFVALVHLAFAASLGILCSVAFTTTGRSICAALVVLLILAIAPMFADYGLLSRVGGESWYRSIREFGSDFSPVSIWQSLLHRSAASIPEAVAAQVLLSLAAYAALTGMLLASAIWIFDRRRQ